MNQEKEDKKEENKEIKQKKEDYDHFILVMARIVKKYSSKLIKEK